MSCAVTVVMVIATAVTWPVYTYVLVPLNLDYLQTVVFILIIAALVQLLETVMHKYMPPLYNALGIYLPLITTNCAVLGVTMLVLEKGAENPSFGYVAVAGQRVRRRHRLPGGDGACFAGDAGAPGAVRRAEFRRRSADHADRRVAGGGVRSWALTAWWTVCWAEQKREGFLYGRDLIAGILIVAGIGLLAGLILAVASAVMAVPKDEKAEAILGGAARCANCWRVRFFRAAAAMLLPRSKGEAKPGLCSPGGCRKRAPKPLRRAAWAPATWPWSTKTALVHCMGSYDCTSDKMRYDGIDSCAASTLLAGGISSCRYGCMGMGDCAAVCEYGAINVCNGMASIDPAKCRGGRQMHRCMSEGAHQLCAAEKAGGRALLQL